MAQTAATPDCHQATGGVACTISAGYYSLPVSESAGSLSVDTYGSFSILAAAPYTYVVNFQSQGVSAVDSSTGRPADGGQAGYVSVTAHDAGAVSALGFSTTGWFYGLLVQSVGGNGGNYKGDDDDQNGGNGGSALGGLFLSNSQYVNLQGEFAGGVAAIHGQGTGGNGGYGASGGSGGYGGVVQVENYGGVILGTASSFATGSSDSGGSAIAGISAQSIGGDAGDSEKNDQRFGGDGGPVSIYSAAPVDIYWTWQGVGPANGNLYGVVGYSLGGSNGHIARTGKDGGAGGNAYGVSVQLTDASDITVVAQNTASAIVYDDNGDLATNQFTGAGVAALSHGRDGGLTYGENATAGRGGNAGIGDTLTSLNIYGATVSVSGNAMAGAVARNQGGNGGSGNSGTYEDTGNPLGGYAADGGVGGSADSLTLGLYNGALVTTSGVVAPGVVALAFGGTGGDGSTYYGENHDAGNGGAGGSAAAVTVEIDASSVATAGDYSTGVLAAARGGNGGNGGGRPQGVSGDAGGGGRAGSAGNVSVALTEKSHITTNGANAAGVLAYSAGGAGGNGGNGQAGTTGSPRDGGDGGSSGYVSVTLESGSTVSTQGDSSSGLVAMSISGFGGNGNTASNVGSSHAGDGGAGGNAGVTIGGVLTAVDVDSGGSIVTMGDDSIGIQALASSGGGGGGGEAGGLVWVGAGTGATAGQVGTVTVVHESTGSITTSGMAALGILAQSISGDGGAGGDLHNAFTGLGGSAGFATNAGVVEVTNLGSILTSGFNGIGILAQSVGGGGGAGGSADNFSSIGGQGGGGGAGGSTTVAAGGSITTQGDLAAGIIAQSIGGGGGAGGNITTTSAVFGLAIGGEGGDGGNGGSTTVTGNNLAVATSGSQSNGIVAQSIGGGGGAGGSAFNLTASAGFGASVAVGGAGGTGGNGGAATVSLTNTSIVTASSVQDATDPEDAAYGTVLNPLDVDAFGVLVQSIGGGGGLGGASSAQAFVQDVAIPGTDKAFAVSLSYSAGGAGGVAGNGGLASLDLTSGVDILTYGNGSHAAYVQSVGGGGGTGGDSSSTSSTFGFKTLSKVTGQANYNLDLTIDLGASGGASGNGGAVEVTLGGTDGVASSDAASNPVQITTLGDAAYGVLAQSVGGGGGNAGSGSGSTQNGTSGSTALKMTITLGGTGSSGGTGGDVSLTALTGTSVATYGDGAIGLNVQSVGGGGGNSGGGSFQLGLPTADEVGKVISGSTTGNTLGKLTSSVTYKYGNTGGTGGNGGAVNVDLTGTSVTTTAEGATAISALSVGGGGGQGGSAGSSGSSDDPNTIENLKVDKKFVNGIANYMVDILKKIQDGAGWSQAMRDSLSNFLPSLNVSISLGGEGGGGGDGGAVNVALDNTYVSTLDDYSFGVAAQSIGGGGGNGGGAVAGGSSGLGSIMKLNMNVALGSSGGDGGDGGAVDVALDYSSINTQGYASHAVMAQSIGGGGGTAGSAQTNSSGYFSLGASRGSSNVTGGEGGTVTLSTDAAAGPTTIITSGDVAMGVLLQSIGGGGGIGGDGFTLTPGILAFSGDVQLSAGGVGAYGSGGAIIFDPDNLPYLNILTNGASAYGILAQSVGGGGGLAFRQPGTAGTYKLGGTNMSGTADGGAVSVALRDGSSVRTNGDGSHAIFAQSVGGGGGIVGLAAGTTELYKATPADGVGGLTSGYGGTVTVDLGNVSIETYGASAYGVFAQSVGASGGVKSGNDGVSVIAGTTGPSGSYGLGGRVDVSLADGGVIYATGENSVGIFAQSVGVYGTGTASSGGVNIQMDGEVVGGSGAQGAAIWVDTDASTNSITISSTGYVSALSNLAITSSGQGTTNVTNNGHVAGNWDLIAGTVTSPDTLTAMSTAGLGYGTFTNGRTGVLVAGTRLDGHLVNEGTVRLGEVESGAATRLAGSFTQTDSGVIIVHADFVGETVDKLVVGGDAALGGEVQVLASSLLPNRTLTFLEVAGSSVGTLQGGRSNVFQYDVEQAGDAFSISARADFSAAGISLSGHQLRAAHYLQNIWNAGGGSFGGVFGYFSALQATDYANDLSQLADSTAGAPAEQSLLLGQQHLDRLMSCPVFEGDTAIVTQTSCVWAVGAGQVFDQSGFNGSAGYDSTTYSFAMGAQKEVEDGWFVGLAGGYDDSSITSSSTSIDGESGWAGVTLKREQGPWLFATALTGSFGSFDNSRFVMLGTDGGLAQASNTAWGLGGRLRIAYTQGEDRFYVKPFVDLDVMYNYLSGYTESGAGLLDRRVEGNGQWTGLATPGVEIGTRVALNDDYALRAYVRAGGTFSTTDSWTTTTALAAAPAGLDGLSVVLPMDDVYARIGAGLDLVSLDKGMNLRAEYEGGFSAHSSSNMGTLRFSVNF